MNSADLKTTHQGVTLPDFKIVEQPELKIYYEGFGTGRADYCIVAEDDGNVVGAVRMYEKVGFKTVNENDEEYIMVYEFASELGKK